MTKKLTSSDIYDINKKTGALILGKNRLDDYATKYLTKHCKEALLTPMPLPVEKILTEAQLTVREVSLSRNLDIFGCCLLLDGEVDIYDADIEPRFLKERCYDTFYLNSEKGAIGGGIHEIIHFVWFYVWNRLFGDSYDEYERPSLKWILSEMVVESVMKDERLRSINPYFPRENGGCIYPYFFDMVVDGKLILDTLDAMYRSQNIEDFMRNSYAYCQDHELEIQEHILKAEEKYAAKI